MSRNQFAALIVVVIIGFTAITVAGWFSDRAAQESNRQAVSRVHDDLLAANRNLVTIHRDIHDLENVVRIQTRWNTRDTKQITSAISGAQDDEDQFVSLTDEVSGLRSDFADSEVTGERRASRRHAEMIKELSFIGSQLGSPPAAYCHGLRDRQDELSLWYNNAQTVHIQQIYGARLSALALLSAIVDCDYLLYP